MLAACGPPPCSHPHHLSRKKGTSLSRCLLLAEMVGFEPTFQNAENSAFWRELGEILRPLERTGERDSGSQNSGMAGSQRLLHHRQHLRPPRLRFQTLVCTGDAGRAGLWQCVSMMPYAHKTGWTGDVSAKKNGQTNKIHLSIRFGGASGSRTLAPVSRPIAFRVRPLTTT